MYRVSRTGGPRFGSSYKLDSIVCMRESLDLSRTYGWRWYCTGSGPGLAVGGLGVGDDFATITGSGSTVGAVGFFSGCFSTMMMGGSGRLAGTTMTEGCRLTTGFSSLTTTTGSRLTTAFSSLTTTTGGSGFLTGFSSDAFGTTTTSGISGFFSTIITGTSGFFSTTTIGGSGFFSTGTGFSSSGF